jgi:hypothetical protein
VLTDFSDLCHCLRKALTIIVSFPLAFSPWVSHADLAAFGFSPSSDFTRLTLLGGIS